MLVIPTTVCCTVDTGMLGEMSSIRCRISRPLGILEVSTHSTMAAGGDGYVDGNSTAAEREVWVLVCYAVVGSVIWCSQQVKGRLDRSDTSEDSSSDNGGRRGWDGHMRPNSGVEMYGMEGRSSKCSRRHEEGGFIGGRRQAHRHELGALWRLLQSLDSTVWLLEGVGQIYREPQGCCRRAGESS